MPSIHSRPLDSLIPYASNPRTHSPEQIAQIAASIVEFGWTNPILIDGSCGVIAGHGRLAAARQLGLAEVPVIELTHLTPTQRKALVIADNRLALEAGWNEAMLGNELASLLEDGFDLALTGFAEEEWSQLIESIVAEHTPEAAPESDDAASDSSDLDPDPDPIPVSRPGDVWVIGRHRLVCGDASDPAIVSALMQGEQAALCFTSPPYDQQRRYTGELGDWDELMRGVCSRLPMAEDGQVLINLGLVHHANEVTPYWDGWIAWMRSNGWRRFGWYVWDQGDGLPGNWAGRLAPAFEFIFHFNRQSRQPNKITPCKHAGSEIHLHADGSATALRHANGRVLSWSHEGTPIQSNRIPDAVVRIGRKKGPLEGGVHHPAVFPVELPRFVMEAYSDPDAIVYDPFSGSGSTILAAELCGRQARCVEIAPEYVDAAIQRFQHHHPEIDIVLESTGESYDATRQSRQREAA